MHPFSVRTHLALAGALTLIPASIAAQDLDSQVLQMLRRADQTSLDRVWQIGRQLGEIGDSEESLAQSIGNNLGSAKAHGRLAAATALQELTDSTEFSDQLFAALEPLLTGDQEDVVASALALASRDSYFNRGHQGEIQDLIRPMVGSDLTKPIIRVAAAKALWRVGSSEDRSTCRTVLQDFVRSADRSLQIMGALALAETNDGFGGPGWQVLREIANEPTPEGRLARTFIKIENQRRSFESLMVQLADPNNPGAPATGSSGGDLVLIQEVLALVNEAHVRGDQVSKKRMLEEAARGILRSMDRHSTYFSSDEFQKFYFDLNPEYGGIGAFVNFDQDNVFSIVRPIYSGPAYESHLRSGDKIIAVDAWETQGHTSDEIVSRLKGEPGTSVNVKIFRLGWSEPKNFEIVRRQIQVPSVNHELLPGDIGYVEVITFGAKTAQELLMALLDLKSQGVKGLVLDLRNNTGGYLEIAKDIVGLFVSGEKLVVYTEGRAVPRQDYVTANRPAQFDLPMAVLINGFSASASEITAGAFQDYERATIVGERSFGKGSVQSLVELQSDRQEPYQDANRNRQFDEWEEYQDLNGNGKHDIGPRLKLTIAQYFLPSGRLVHKEIDENGVIINEDWGVTPDKVLPLRDNPVRDRWKEAVIYDLLEQDVFRKYTDQHLSDNESLFVELAEGDEGDSSRYPGFDEFYANLDTKLPEDDIRRWLRYYIRDAVADLRGKAFPGGRAVGDFQEDAQLQEAVRSVLDDLDTDIRTIADYSKVLKIKIG